MTTLTCIDQSQTEYHLIPDAVCSGFRELGIYRFQALPANASLYIDEALLETISTSSGPMLQWRPGFYAGRVSVELVDRVGRRLAIYHLDVAPDERKLGSDLFQSMLDDLYAFDPALVLGTEAAQSSIGVAGDVTTLLLQYARLRRHADAVLAAFSAITEHPLTRLRHERRRIPFHQVKRIDATSARQMMRHPDVGALLRRAPLHGASLPSMEVVHSYEDLDNPANRALASSLAALRLRCGNLAEALLRIAQSEKAENTRTPLGARVGRKLMFLEAFSARLRSLAKRLPYAAATQTEINASGLTAISANPDYARAYRLGWAALRPGVAGLDRDESLWISPTWEIYERWCFVQVVQAIQSLFPELTWTCQRSATVDVVRHIGSAESVRVEVLLQRTFQSAGQPNFGMSSVSLQLKPDIVVTAEIGPERRMLVLDAKYRTSRQGVLDAMRSAHIYQDALRWKGQRPDCSLLLVPRAGGASWLEDAAFHTSHRTGIHVLSPDQDPSELRAMLERWMNPA
ncbi:DUF2357 domain-containing protein [Stenotrophomonas sp. G106K1]|uniref:DUF2357 domain-containing protein n=1 Tax=Stenotrophomonas sp. G106K1 TaxID=3134792 RepID=UPI0030F49624